ncbi:MAG: hypothetical protein LIO90_05650 [Bacteroidales bacterium]|nr:hypothetical protein [Bacteroidales bacterium]
MDNTLQNLIVDVCQGFPTQDVGVSNINDAKRLARMAHYAWKHEIGFHPDMFNEALRGSAVFANLSDEDLEDKARELCHQADFAKLMFHAAFDLEGLTL